MIYIYTDLCDRANAAHRTDTDVCRLRTRLLHAEPRPMTSDPMTRPNPLTRESLGTCTWILQLGNGSYVYEIATARSGYSVDEACLWFSAERAIEVAKATPWIGESARAVRARP